MKMYTLFFIYCLASLVGAGVVSAQGFTGPGTNSSPGHGAYPPPPPPPPGHGVPPPPPPPPPHPGLQGFTGPGTNGQPVMVSQPVSINEARNYPHDSWVVITGNIVNALPGGRHFMFRDLSGEIPVEIGPKEWRGLSAATSDTVEICGEVKIERGQIFIKVHAITAAANAGRYAVTINEARNLPHDSWVVLTGNIVYSLPPPHDYTFRDSSGDITVDIGPKEWRGLSVGVSDTVEISGEVKIHRGQVSIKVHAIRII